jgi:hypothetical protein
VAVLKVELDEQTLRKLVCDYLSNLLNVTIVADDVKIQVKTTQNYRAEWENGAFRATVNKTL